MVGIPSWVALVHFADGTTKVVTLFEVPQRGDELVGLVDRGWIVAEISVREGEIEGQSYQYEITAKRDNEGAGTA